jgi:outer membrane protein assembly factor BamB
LYATRFPGGIYALNASDGAITWVRAEPPDVVWTVAAALQGMVYADTRDVGANTSVIDALSASDGALRWSYQSGIGVIAPIVG